MSPPSKALLNTIVEIGERAGREILSIYNSKEFETTYKDDNSPLTTADQNAHDLIARHLNETMPAFPVISEEDALPDYAERSSWHTCWMVDPLDGTKEFLKRNGEFTVNIALIEHGKPTLGVVHAPVLGLTYFAAKGLGAFKKADGGEPLQIRAGDYRQKPFKVVGSRSHRSESLERVIQKTKPDEIISMGSSLKICLVAEGAAHLYPRLGPTMEWDTAAAHAVLSEAGGTLTDLEGNEISYNRENMKNTSFVVCGSPPFPWKELEIFESRSS